MTVSDRLAAALADRYRLERELGQGGMATVYLAADLKHDRQVAIKVLKPDLAAVLGAERFVQEIKTTAALSHPHILPLFDSGEAGGFLYYVMPYLQGETIREKLTRETQFGIDEAVRITREVADALDYAHRHGVVHRDIKPENILFYDGRAMVMDFGIALAVSAAAGGRMTETGLSLGTPHYMSPEQATADKSITGRSDIYSLASVCYEMLAGEPPHSGGSAQAIIMKIVTEDAQPVTRLRKSVPPNVAAALMKALEKVPADRFDSARDFARALVNPAFTTGSRGAAAAVADGVQLLGRKASWRAIAGALAVTSVALAAGLAWNTSRPRPEAPAIRTMLSLPDSAVLNLDLSRDGRRMVYSTRTSEIFVRDIDRTEVRRLESGRNPRLSTDGRHVAFLRLGDGRLWVMPVDGGSAEVRADSANAYAWGDDGYLYASSGHVVLRVPLTAGSVDTVARFDAETGRRPVVQHILPGSRAAVGSRATGELSRVEFLFIDFASQEVRPLRLTGRTARYIDAGFLVLLEGPTIFDTRVSVVRFDARSGRVLGVPVPVAPEAGEHVVLAASGNGTVVYDVAVADRPGRMPSLIDRSGTPRPLPGVDSAASAGSLSPSGTDVAYVVYRDPMAFRSPMASRESDVWVASLVGSPPQRRTFGGGVRREIIGWGAREETVVFAEYSNDSVVVMSVPANGSAPSVPAFFAAPLPSSDSSWVRFALARDGRRLAWNSDDGLRSVLLGDTTVTLTRIEQSRPFNFKFSPDGRWVSYTSNPGTGPDIYIQSIPLAGGTIQVSDGRGNGGEGGVAAFWSRDGRSLYYTSLQNDLIEARLDLVQRRVADRRRLFNGPVARDVLPGDSLFWGSGGSGLFRELQQVLLVNATTEFRRLLEGR
jgi:serine/threonine-protein kinase